MRVTSFEMLTGDSVGLFIFEAQLVNLDQLITAHKSLVFGNYFYCEDSSLFNMV